MPAPHPPAVFVSSTCYDLSQIRRDMKSFIERMGFEPVLSEFESFPVDPSASTIDTCRQVVRDKADLFVLIVGDRYGSICDNGHSITNLEYLAALAKGIPIYAFVSKQVLNLVGVWKDNPKAIFSKVDSPKLFEFVSSLRESGELWVYPFESAEDIESVLRAQWAHLFNDALRVWRQLRPTKDAELYKDRSPAIIRLLVDKPFAWQYHLFSCALTEGLSLHQSLKRDWQLGLGPGDLIVVRREDFFGWIETQTVAAMRLIQGFVRLLNQEYPEAVALRAGDPDPKRALYVADRIVHRYGEMLRWAMTFNRVHTDEVFQGILDIMSQLLMTSIEKIEQLESRCRNVMAELVSNPPANGEHREVAIEVVFETPKDLITNLYSEMTQLAHKLGIEWEPEE